MKTRTFFAGALLVAACLSAPAEAGPYLIRYTGQVISGVDALGLFGLPGQDLAGQDFSADFTLWDPSANGSEGMFVDGGTTYQRLTSGQLVNAPPVISAVVTIGGQSFPISGGYFGQASFQDDFPSDDEGNLIDSASVFAYGNDSRTIVYSAIGNMAASMLDSASLTARNRYDLEPGDIGNGYLRSTELVGGANVATDLAFRPLTFESGPFSSTPAVPEPSSWAMLLAGFAGLGTVLRRSARRSRPGPAAAAI